MCSPTSTGRSRWYTKDGTLRNVTRSHLPLRQVAVTRTSPPGVSLRIVELVPDVFTVMTLVAAGVGIGVLSEPLTCVAIPGMVFRKLSGVTRMSEVAAVYRKNESAPAVKVFLDFLRAKSRVH